jgi:hypothetical protein
MPIAPRFFEPAPGQPVGPFDRVPDLRVHATLGRQQPGALQVQDQAGKRVGEHVVHFAGEALPLGQRGGLGLRGAGLLHFGEQKFCPLVTFPKPPGEKRQEEEGQDPEII